MSHRAESSDTVSTHRFECKGIKCLPSRSLIPAVTPHRHPLLYPILTSLLLTVSKMMFKSLLAVALVVVSMTAVRAGEVEITVDTHDNTTGEKPKNASIACRKSPPSPPSSIVPY